MFLADARRPAALDRRGGRAAHPVRARRRARIGASRGRGRLDVARGRRRARARPSRRRVGRSARPSSSSAPEPEPASGDARMRCMPDRDGLRPAAVPVRPARPVRHARAPRTTAGSSTSRSARRAIRRRPPSSPRWPRRTPSAATRRASARRRCAARSAGWIDRRFGVDVALDQHRRLRRDQGARRAPRRSSCSCARPSRDTVLYPAVAYPTYEMGAILAGCRPVPVPMRARRGHRSRRDRPRPTRDRALMLWVNSPSNPTGALSDLDAAAAWGRAHDVPVFSDECYVEFTWDGPAADDPRDRHRRASSRCTRCRSGRTSPGCASASTPATASSSTTCKEVRKHVGMLVPGPGAGGGRRCARRRRARRGAARALPRAGSSGLAHILSRGPAADRRCRPAASTCGSTPATDGRSPSGWRCEGGALVSPGDFYGAGGANNVRVAVVQTDDRIEQVAERLGVH